MALIFISMYFFAYLYFFYFDLLPIVKKKYYKLFTINVVITLLSFILVILVALGISVPNPSNLIETVVRMIIG